MKLFSEVRSIQQLELVTDKGDVIAVLNRRVNTDTSDYKLTFDAQVQPENQFTMPQDTDVPVVLRAVVRSLNNAGFSDELLHVRSISVTMKGDATSQTINVPINGPFPKHQTAFGRITSVLRTSPATATLQTGTNVIISSYAFTGEAVEGKNLKLRQLVFTLVKNGSVTVSNWSLVHPASGASVACSMNEEFMTITCPLMNQPIGALSAGTPLVLDLTASVTVPTGMGDSVLQTSLATAGSPESLGSIEWTDESGTFRWIEGATPVVIGTRLQ